MKSIIYLVMFTAFSMFGQENIINQTHTNATLFFGITTDWHYLSQGIKLDGDYTINSITLRLHRLGNPTTGQVWVEIHNAANSQASSLVANATSVKINSDVIPSATDTTFVFSTPPVLEAGSDYYIVAKESLTKDGSNYFRLSTSTWDPYRNGEGAPYGYARINTVDTWFPVATEDFYMIVNATTYVAPVITEIIDVVKYNKLNKANNKNN